MDKSNGPEPAPNPPSSSSRQRAQQKADVMANAAVMANLALRDSFRRHSPALARVIWGEEDCGR